MPVWPRPVSTVVLAVAIVLAGAWFAATVYPLFGSSLHARQWTSAALAAATGLVVMHGLAFGRPLTTGHVAVAMVASVVAVGAQMRGDTVVAHLAVLAAAVMLVWPTGAAAQPGALPEVWALIDHTRRDPLAPFAMDRQKRYLFSTDGAAALAYRVRAGFAVVSGDPIGDPHAYRGVITAFMALCRARGWHPVVLAASPRCAALWRHRDGGRRALWAVPIGRDVVIDVAVFTLRGRGKRNLRQAVQRTHNAGMTTAVIAEAELDAALRAELVDVAENAIRAERGFSMMLDGTLTDRYPGTWLIVARDRAGVVQAFHRYATAGGGSEVSLDLPWRRPDAPNGTDERLTIDMIAWAKSRGGQRVSLAFAPFPELFATGPGGHAARMMRLMLHAADGLIKLESLYRYLRKYDALGPRRYVLLNPVDLLPALVVLLTLEFSTHRTPSRVRTGRRAAAIHDPARTQATPTVPRLPRQGPSSVADAPGSK